MSLAIGRSPTHTLDFGLDSAVRRAAEWTQEAGRWWERYFPDSSILSRDDQENRSRRRGCARVSQFLGERRQAWVLLQDGGGELFDSAEPFFSLVHRSGIRRFQNGVSSSLTPRASFVAALPFCSSRLSKITFSAITSIRLRFFPPSSV